MLIYEKYIKELLRCGAKIDPLMSYPAFLDMYSNVPRPNESKTQVHYESRAYTQHEKYGGLEYQIGKDFYKAMRHSASRLDLSKIPTKLLASESVCYQVTLPEAEAPIHIIEILVSENGDFNLFINQFFFYENIDDNKFSYYVLRGNKQQTCEELLEGFRDSQNLQSQGLTLSFKEIFKLLINLILYINSGQPDLRHLKGASKKGIEFKGKKRAQKIRKYHDVSFHDSILVGFNFKKETLVNGHFRWQPHGKGRQQVKLIWIDAFTKGDK